MLFRASFRNAIRALPLIALTVTPSLVALATPVNFTLSSTASTLDLTATGTALGSDFTVTEQNASAKANKYFNPSGSFLNTNLYPGSMDYPGDSVVRADVQRGLFNVATNLVPGTTATGKAAPGNYGVTMQYPLATPIVIPQIPISGYGTISPGKITGVRADVALRNMDLDFDSSKILRTGAQLDNFNAQDVDISFAAGTADISFGGVLDVAGLTGLGSIADSVLGRAAVAAALQALVPSTSGITLTVVNDTALFSTKMTIGTWISQPLSTLGTLQNVTTGTGLIQHVLSPNTWKLTLPVEIDLGQLIDPSLTSLLGLTMNLNLKGNLVGSAAYVVPVPEPSSLLLAVAGFAAVVGYGARLRKRK